MYNRLSKASLSSQKEESIIIQRAKVCFLVPFLQDNIKLKSQVHGQESVIEGLRAERKLWGQELAQQGRQRVGCLGFTTVSQGRIQNF